MGISELIALMSGLVKFLPEIRKLIKILSTAPAQKSAYITKLISDEAAKLQSGGRPTWEE